MTSDIFDQNSTGGPVGLYELIRQFHLRVPAPAVRSEIIAGSRRTLIAGDGIVQQYPKAKGYRAEGLEGHLRFALKYEPVDLAVYRALFQKIDKADLEGWIKKAPHGIYARRAWYLYELLTGNVLDIQDVSSGRYIDLLNPDLHIVGPRRLITRHRLNDNLLGNKNYCPLIRRTALLEQNFKKNLADQARTLVAGIDPTVLKRAVAYLFTKETKSSFAIEGEKPSKGRTERFVAALARAESFDLSDKQAFIELQNAIVDPRYAEKDWRDTQVYVGETLHDYSQHVHFPCPTPQDVPGLMHGWMETMQRLVDPDSGVDQVCAAAAGAFGFVFIHPFIDGNGRIHRFLVHHILAKTEFTPPGLLFPVSACMIRDMKRYDQSLEHFSKAIRPFVDFTLDSGQRMTVINETTGLYQYFDATVQAEYLYACIEDTLGRDLKDELDFLRFFDTAVRAVMNIVDMPNQRAALLVRLIHQNNGKLSKGKRGGFTELTNEEIEQMETAIGHKNG
jgi:Fic family protein